MAAAAGYAVSGAASAASGSGTSGSKEDARQRGIRPGAPGYTETPLLSIGKEVRVTTKQGCRCGTISYVDDDDGTVDVIYGGQDSRQDGNDDACQAEGEEAGEPQEETVPVADVSALRPFELKHEKVWSAEFAADPANTNALVKDQGNELFKLKDFAAAVKHYSIALNRLRKFECKFGSRPAELLEPAPDSSSSSATSSSHPSFPPWVLMNHGGALTLGFVKWADPATQKADIYLYKPGEPKQLLLKGASFRQLVLVHEEMLLLHSSLYMNRARCYVNLGSQAAAAQDLSMVIGLWAARSEGALRLAKAGATAHGGEDQVSAGVLATPLSEEEAKERVEQLTKAYYLRAKTRVSRGKFEPARADLAEARGLNPGEAQTRLLDQLGREILQAQKEQVRSNKRIAKEVAKWADQAMSNLTPEALEAIGRGLPPGDDSGGSGV